MTGAAMRGPRTSRRATGLDTAFKALASEPRRRVLRLLAEAGPPGKTCCAEQEVCACKLSDRLGLAPSTVSHHMSVLVGAGLVSARREGLWVYYSLDRGALARVAQEIEAF